VATTALGAELTQQYVSDQLALRAATVAEITSLWPLLDQASLDATFPRYFLGAQSAVLHGRDRMTSLTQRYYRAFREAEGVPGEIPVLELALIDPAQLLASLTVTGPVWAKRAVGKGIDVRQAMRMALQAQSGAASRLVLDSGRSALDATVRADRRALGWYRVTHGKACAFCAMLASRGAVYHTARAAGDQHRYHDHCACTVEPIFSRDSAMPDDSAFYRIVWNETTKGLSGKDAYNAFRAVIEK
jgi:hypothetical protein